MLKIDEIIQFVLANDLKYTGSHQYSYSRTKVTLPILEPEMQLKQNLVITQKVACLKENQLKLIWKEFSNYIESRLLQGESIKIPNFGIFIFTNNNLLNTFSNKEFTKSFMDINKLYTAKLIFQLDNNYRNILKKFQDEKIKKKIMQPLEYFEPKKIINWNPYSIAKKCFMNEIVINDGINNIFKAIYDLVKIGKNLEIELGFFKFFFNNREIVYSKDNIFGL